jgi:hypothetical protein
VSTHLQGPDVQIRLAAAGGQIGPNPGQSLPRVQVECWGRGGTAGGGAPVDDGTASQLARTVLADLPTGGVSVSGGVVAGAWADGHPFESDDPSTGRPRWIVQLRLDLFPVP